MKRVSTGEQGETASGEGGGGARVGERGERGGVSGGEIVTKGRVGDSENGKWSGPGGRGGWIGHRVVLRV